MAHVTGQLINQRQVPEDAGSSLSESASPLATSERWHWQQFSGFAGTYRQLMRFTDADESWVMASKRVSHKRHFEDWQAGNHHLQSATVQRKTE